MGGSTSGITSGLDRKPLKEGTDPYDRALSTTERAMKDLERFKGENTRSDRLLPGNVPNFLTSFGLNLMSQTPRGKGFSGLLSTAATAAKEPFQTFQAAQLAKKDDEMNRAEDLFSGALASEYDLEEQRIKNLKPGDDSRLSPEVERDIITNAQQTIFDQRAIIDNPESTPEEIAAAKNRITINQNVLVKELGVPPEYAAILGDPDLFGDAIIKILDKNKKINLKNNALNFVKMLLNIYRSENILFSNRFEAEYLIWFFFVYKINDKKSFRGGISFLVIFLKKGFVKSFWRIGLL